MINQEFFTSLGKTMSSWLRRTGFSLLVLCLVEACSGPLPAAAVLPAATHGLPANTPSTDPAQTVASQPALPQPTQAQPALSQTTGAAPECTSPASLTPALTEGPYFKANSPERANLLDPGMPGMQLTLTGYVLTADCKPVAHALLDFWQANAAGQYDNSGYTLRGHQYTDANGRYQLITVVPGLYPGRTEHIHFKVQAPNGPLLTSQLFFPDVTNNESDQIYNPALVINMVKSGSEMAATFNFVIKP